MQNHQTYWMMPWNGGCAGLEEGPSGLVSVNLVLVDTQLPGTEGHGLVWVGPASTVGPFSVP